MFKAFPFYRMLLKKISLLFSKKILEPRTVRYKWENRLTEERIKDKHFEGIYILKKYIQNDKIMKRIRENISFNKSLGRP